jgi:hypothetical protein
MQHIYNAHCHKFLRENPASKINRYNVCSLACNAYNSALSVVNLRSSFKRTGSGIYPFNPDAILDSQLAPSKAYTAPESVTTELVPAKDVPLPTEFFKNAEKFISDKQTFEHKKQNKTISGLVSGKCISSPTVQQQIIAHKSEMKHKSSLKSVSGKKQKCVSLTSTSNKRKRELSLVPQGNQKSRLHMLSLTTLQKKKIQKKKSVVFALGFSQ